MVPYAVTRANRAGSRLPRGLFLLLLTCSLNIRDFSAAETTRGPSEHPHVISIAMLQRWSEFGVASSECPTGLHRGACLLDSEWHSVALSGLLAVEHFNQRNGQYVPAFDSSAAHACDKRLALMGLIDIGGQAISTLQDIASLQRDPANLPDVIVSPTGSDGSVGMVSLAGLQVYNIISYWPSSPEASLSERYPRFMRTIPSDDAVAFAICSFWEHEMQFEAAAIISSNDAKGERYKQALQRHCLEDVYMDLRSFAFEIGSPEGIEEAVKAFGKTGINIALVIASASNTVAVFESAVKQKVLRRSPQSLWAIADSVSPTDLFALSDEAKEAVDGSVHIVVTGATETNSRWRRFVQEWPTFTPPPFSELLPSNWSSTTEFFSTFDVNASTIARDVGTFFYDAVATAALQACAVAPTGPVPPTFADDFFNAKSNTSFAGLSGSVQFDDIGDRALASSNFMLSNILLNNQIGEFTFKTRAKFQSNQWSWLAGERNFLSNYRSRRPPVARVPRPPPPASPPASPPPPPQPASPPPATDSTISEPIFWSLISAFLAVVGFVSCSVFMRIVFKLRNVSHSFGVTPLALLFLLIRRRLQRFKRLRPAKPPHVHRALPKLEVALAKHEPLQLLFRRYTNGGDVMLFNQWLQFRKSEQKEHNEVEIVEEFLKGQYETSFNTISSHYNAGLGHFFSVPVMNLHRTRRSNYCDSGEKHFSFGKRATKNSPAERKTNSNGPIPLLKRLSSTTLHRVRTNMEQGGHREFSFLKKSGSKTGSKKSAGEEGAISSEGGEKQRGSVSCARSAGDAPQGSPSYASSSRQQSPRFSRIILNSFKKTPSLFRTSPPPPNFRGTHAQSSRRTSQSANNVRSARAIAETAKGLTYEQFALAVVSASNKATCPTAVAAKEPLRLPFGHYWIASSHNTYLTGHQLTSESTADMYRRQLLQGCRCVEIDIWDGARGDPDVTHGYTLVTREKLRRVVAAIKEEAFTVSDAPLILSLEVRCSLKQQLAAARILHEILGPMLFTADDEGASELSSIPVEQLAKRIIVKSKTATGRKFAKKLKEAEANGFDALDSDFSGPYGNLSGPYGTHELTTSPHRKRKSSMSLTKSWGSLRTNHSRSNATLESITTAHAIPFDAFKCIAPNSNAADDKSFVSFQNDGRSESKARFVPTGLSSYLPTISDLGIVLTGNPTANQSRQRNTSFTDSPQGSKCPSGKKAKSARVGSTESLTGPPIGRRGNVSVGVTSSLANSSVTPPSARLPATSFPRSERPKSFAAYVEENLAVQPSGPYTGLLTTTSLSDDKWRANPQYERARSSNPLAEVNMYASLRSDVAVHEPATSTRSELAMSCLRKAPGLSSSMRSRRNKKALASSQRGIVPKMSSRGAAVLPDAGDSSELNDLDATREWAHEQQWRTLFHLVRIYPRALRTRSDNYDPLPCWASGVQLCALNLQTNDLPTQLHYALFELNGGTGYVPKPQEMLASTPCWPPPRVQLKVVTVQPITLFQLPKRNAERPMLDGARSRVHDYVHELSFSHAKLKKQGELGQAPYLPSVCLELHAIGGFHCVSATLPPSSGATRQLVRTLGFTGDDFHYNDKVHCIAAEPNACVLRVAVVNEEAGQEVAYDTVVLGAVREGYRVIHLRSMLGTRIESCYLLVHIAFSTQVNAWVGEHELVQTLYKQRLELDESRARVAELESKLEKYEGRGLDRAPNQASCARRRARGGLDKAAAAANAYATSADAVNAADATNTAADDDEDNDPRLLAYLSLAEPSSPNSPPRAAASDPPHAPSDLLHAPSDPPHASADARVGIPPATTTLVTGHADDSPNQAERGNAGDDDDLGAETPPFKRGPGVVESFILAEWMHEPHSLGPLS